MRKITDKAILVRRQVHVCVIDLEKAFNIIVRKDIWGFLE